tara:strand:+ start:376 stop:915 length:540 start_codon:yes stop_codon:yes gene_type:complete
MIQLVRSATASQEYFRLNIYDEFTGTNTYTPLCTFTSQASGNSVSVSTIGLGAPVFANKERYVLMSVIVSTASVPQFGVMTFGNTDLPYGLYDVVIYENSSDDNLDPTGLNVVWKGLANLSAQQTGDQKNPAVEYTEYSDNDSDNESVYITNIPNDNWALYENGNIILLQDGDYLLWNT